MKIAAGLLVAAFSVGVAHAKEIIEVRAQNFTSNQNVASGAPDGYGDCIVTRRPGNLPTSAEYKIDVQDAGQYQLTISYAALDPRPVTLTVNGQIISSNAASAPTGGWVEGNRVDSNEGMIPLRAGTNRLVFSRSSDFPHIHAFKVEGP